MSSQTDDITQHPEPDTKDARIAILEADNARLMGLVKEAGKYAKHLSSCSHSLPRAIASRVGAPTPCTCGVYDTLAKIKEATHERQL